MINPLDSTGNIGYYRIGLRFANAAAQAGPLVSFRYAPGPFSASIGACYLWRVSVSAVITTAFTTPQVIDLALFKATGWTSNDTGGTVVSFAGNSNKERTGMPATQVTQLMTGTAAITAGTRTLDTNPHSSFILQIGGSTGNAVLNASPDAMMFTVSSAPYDLPLELLNQEGFVIQPITALGAAGVVVWNFRLVWSEGH